jgi:acetyl-CoA synthetase
MMIRLNPEMNTFLQSRDFLLQHRNHYAAAYQGFSWPVLDQFNWALDYFDPMAAENQHPALIVLDETGHRATITFDAMSRA